jgi:hypothetical protein
MVEPTPEPTRQTPTLPVPACRLAASTTTHWLRTSLCGCHCALAMDTRCAERRVRLHRIGPRYHSDSVYHRSVKDGKLIKTFKGEGGIFEVCWNHRGDKVKPAGAGRAWLVGSLLHPYCAVHAVCACCLAHSFSSIAVF